MRNKFIVLSILIILYLCGSPVYANTDLSAKAAVLIDTNSGRVLYSKNMHDRLPQASTTKITTALVVLENMSLNTKIQIPKNFVNPGESGICLEPGEIHTVEDLLYSLLLKSANDAATALAISTAGSESGFIEMMNKRVRKLGLNNTHYENPHGLHHDNHYSSAYDLAMITREALKNEKFRSFINTRCQTIPWPGHDYSRIVYNGNKLLNRYQGADGVKTGYTKQAGSCLVGSATRNGLQLIAVVLNSNQMYGEVSQLLDYGFNNYRKINYYEKGQTVRTISIKGGEQQKLQLLAAEHVSLAVKPEEISQVEYNVNIPQKVYAPVKKGESIGNITVKLNNDVNMKVKLIAKENINSKSMILYLWNKITSTLDFFWYKDLTKITCIS
ncbi:MAG: D-alanyl-D-alanine carboxypeptidase family protein [Bacillota bacterium]